MSGYAGFFEEPHQEREYQLDPYEEIAIRLVDIANDIRELQKKRKKDNKIVHSIADHLAEMLRGSQEMPLLNELIGEAVALLDQKEKQTVELKSTPTDTVEVEDDEFMVLDGEDSPFASPADQTS